MTSIDREIEKVTHDLWLANRAGQCDKKLSDRLENLYEMKAHLQQEQDAVLSRFEAEHKPTPRKPVWWDKLGMEPTGDTTLKDGEWKETK